MKAPTGYYRKWLTQYSGVRLALTNSPMSGVVRREDLIDSIIAVIPSDDEYASYYIDGLRNGEMVPIVVTTYNKYYSPGELFFTS